MPKFEITIKEKKGTCEKPLFEKMARNGDITSEKVSEKVGNVIVIKGYAVCTIKIEGREFDLVYYATEDGYISSGSEVFKNSVITYLDETTKFKINELKTKKGKTYKASPIIESETEDDLPF